ncbi:hypothetical protein G9A89_018794 [Geosiphon pyriformis]|nr:hypothetical protein G9A89_018794 [Geosiphon pyriformis]
MEFFRKSAVDDWICQGNFGLDNSHKWCLSSGKIVEDAMYEFGCPCTHEHLCHSFVLDPQDTTYEIEGIFTKAEILNDIREEHHPRASAALETPIGSADGFFLREVHHDFDWLHQAIHSLVREYESGALNDDHHEQWFNVHFRGAEAGRFYKSEQGTKWMVESSLKLPKMLKDMLMQLGSEVGWSCAILRELKTVGFIHGDGSRIRLPKGICLSCALREHLQSCEQCDQAHESDVTTVGCYVESEGISMLGMFQQAAVKECIQKVLMHVSNEEATGEVLKLAMNAGTGHKGLEDIIRIPQCFSTPTSKTKRFKNLD